MGRFPRLAKLASGLALTAAPQLANQSVEELIQSLFRIAVTDCLV
jgi:hypothetical protein